MLDWVGMSDDARWDAVRQRSRAADGGFVYAVATTGVYCRPCCPARLALRRNVTFHPTPEAARLAGFRACKRCRPDGVSAYERHAQAVAQACRAIDAAVADGEPAPGLGALADQAGLSAYHFHRVFRAVAGVTPAQYAAAARARRARTALATEPSVTEAIHGAGYGSSSRFYQTAQARLGMAPRAWRDGGRGETIRFAVGQCALGAVLVAATGAGVCAIEFGDDPAALLAGLHARFSRATLLGADAAFEGLVARVVALVERPGLDAALPLDVRGTAFQQRVWQALRAIPSGSVATYSEIAAAIGAPRAVRAVAGACAANPVAVAIPCHRVVRAGGALAGYRWGIARKRALLDREAGRGPRR